jgi:DNA-binding XRE family transcriptional regulator
MHEALEDIIHGTLLGDACISITSGKYFNYKHIAKDKNYLEWQSRILKRFGINGFIGMDNKDLRTYRLGFYINSRKIEFLDSLHSKWYKRLNGRNFKKIPRDIKITPTTLLHWYLGDGCLVRANENRIPRVVLATNSFSKDDIELLTVKIKGLGLTFYYNASASGFNRGAKCGYVMISSTEDGTPYRFFKIIGMKCPEQIENCFTGNKGRGSKRHYFKDKWPTEEDWIRILSNVSGIGIIIRERRNAFKLSRERLAEMVGCGAQHIKRIERGRRFPSVELLKKLLNILHINALYLLKNLDK